MNFIRSLIFNVYYSLITIVIGSAVTLGSVFLPLPTLQAWLRAWTYLTVHGARLICGLRIRQIGQRPPGEQNYVVMSKHQCSWETFYLQMAFSPLSTILKKELLRIPFFGWGLRLSSPVAIDRSNPVKALKQVKEQGIERLNDGRNLLVFPEGTRVAPGQSQKYARSGADIAIAAQVPVIPVAHNAGHCWVNKRFIKKPGTITIVIGEPISSSDKTSRQLTQEVQAWIEAQQNQIESLADECTDSP